MAGNYEEMLDYYPLLIESAIDFKIESRKILATHNGKLAVTLSRVVCLGVFNYLRATLWSVVNQHLFLSYSLFLYCASSEYPGVEPEINGDVENCIVASGYRVVKNAGQFYCLKEG